MRFIRSRRLAAVLLVLLAAPVAMDYVRAFIFARGAGAAAVADSPLGYLTGRLIEALLFVSLLVCAYVLWRRRGQ